jgi:hypothetical protein
MQKAIRRLDYWQGEYTRYLINEFTSGSCYCYYLTDGTTTVRLEDCLIFEFDDFKLSDFDDIVEACTANNGVGTEEYEGWTIVTEETVNE